MAGPVVVEEGTALLRYTEPPYNEWRCVMHEFAYTTSLLQ